MSRLRFTPRPAAGTAPSGPAVHVQTAREAAAALNAIRPRPQITVMRETLGVWHPLFDRLVALWCDTVDGDLPRLAPGSGTDGMVTGGWPCRRWPADWARRRSAWLAGYRRAAERHEPADSRRSAKGNFARLRAALEACEHDSSALAGRQVGWIRRALANTITRHGAPGSPARAGLRAIRQQIAGRPAYADLARVAASRLARFPADGGISSLEAVAADITAGEPAAVPEGEPIPAHLVAKASGRWRHPPVSWWSGASSARPRCWPRWCRRSPPRSRRRPGGKSGSRVAVNGTILEQSQVLTTYNLAILVDALGLRDRVSALAPMAMTAHTIAATIPGT
jgi:hypothetical protein